ncbi:AIPR family protein [Actinoplanes derwentensis]|uniref:AIPR protein n=1 Tax=Actinoplanes derwentensis TaxID=113562 RepID=A0A1H2DBY9_9ACTN|nr:AIPR family protein [Actinoplanes derwentensis]GID87482.1 putative abortive infection phage resistance protein [Actinoplanes derwentensis]SDT80270.1 AIPR protein [Actinoplanes derwentensis]
MSKIHVRHVRQILTNRYSGLIDLEDLASRPEEDQQQAFLSRALAAQAIQHLAGVDAKRAAGAVIDGFDDNGIDAVLAESDPPRVWLVQAKWSDEGRAALGLGDPGKMRIGLDCLVNSEFEKFNSKFQPLAEEVNTAIGTPGVKIMLIVAQMGASQLSMRVKDAFTRILSGYNQAGTEEDVALEVLGLSEFYDMARAGADEPRIDLAVRLDNPSFVAQPYTAYQGTLGAEVVSEWHRKFGQRLFEDNIRKPLGITPVNREIIHTILTDPHHFLYFNNGVTVLCESIQKSARWAGGHGTPVDLTVRGATVVNGAQTVACMHEAMRADPETASNARVWVRLISLEDCPEGFGYQVTQSTNTQNAMNLRDFFSMKETQIRLRDEFAALLDKTYVIKRGDVDPAPATGCSMMEVAIALACTHKDIEYAVRARNGSDVLFETGEQGAYAVLFNSGTDAYRAWRSTLLLRASGALHESLRTELSGRAAQVLVQGDLLVTHILARIIGHRRLSNIDYDWDAEMETVPGMAKSVFQRLVAAIDEMYPRTPVHTVFRNRDRAVSLADRIVRDERKGEPVPELSATYRAASTEPRINAVALIVDRGLIPDGTVLEFRPGTAPQRSKFTPWLAHDPRRGRATWTNDRAKPLIWEIDREKYSPDGLVQHMTSQITGKPSAVRQGVRRWYLAGKGCLTDIAETALVDETERSGS